MISALLLSAATGAVNAEAHFDDAAYFCELRPTVVTAHSVEVAEGGRPKKIAIWYGRIPKEVKVPTDQFGTVAFIHDPENLFPDRYRWENRLPDKFLITADGEWLKTVSIQPMGNHVGEAKVQIGSVKVEGEGQRRVRDYMTGTCAIRAIGIDEFHSETQK